MKTTLFPKWVVLVIFVTTISKGTAETPVMRDASTHEQLVQALREADQTDPMKKMKATTGEDPSVVNRPQDFISQSDIISFQGIQTLVPKRAILQIPKNYRDRVAIQPGAKVVSWAEFYAANRGWITTVEVSREQAEGKNALADDVQLQLTKGGNLVVATYMGGPISMLPLKEVKNPTTTKP
jgi:hypothetical protein